MKCWICGVAQANTGEHLIKASDIRSVFGTVAPKKPLFFHTERSRNRQVRGTKAAILKSRARICGACNNQRTQPHDRAWEKLSYFLRARQAPIKKGDRIRLQKVFPGSVKRSMLDVHLFFLKVYGCQIAEHDVPIDLGPFSEAILQTHPHPYVYLTIGPDLGKGPRSVGGSDITAAKVGDRIVYAVWFYFLDRFSVRVMYAEPGEHRQGLVDAWHPSNISKCLRIAAV